MTLDQIWFLHWSLAMQPVTMKVAWAHLEETYPHIKTIGCAAHTLNPLLKYIMALKTMDTLYKRAKQIVKYVKGKQVASAMYLSKGK